jgi:hypothetical protein
MVQYDMGTQLGDRPVETMYMSLWVGRRSKQFRKPRGGPLTGSADGFPVEGMTLTRIS